MNHAVSQSFKRNVFAVNAHEPFRMQIAIKPRVPPCVIGVAAGLQETRSSMRVGNEPMMERKAHISKSLQACLGEDNNSLEMHKTLEKENQQLKNTLKEKDVIISRLMKIIENQVTKYNKAIELEKEHQKETERRLEESECLVKEQIQLLDDTVRHYTKIIQEQHTQHAQLVSEMKKQNEADIRCREEKIAKLKQYISETFQEKSREHQQQIEELMREINKFVEMSHILKT
ncbi:hypothetical protein JRQ81_005244 [Phrynocephalus forsythii]|uniref:Uncharacterized protein n=1 Tax=Phrynocephalus forsythii TaxID=171643 RepID=A0A9Q1B6S0_9SAUR|nr:hypothetical protein JRQ81_005244 [Phrynocephalus forsythii]